MEEKTEQTNQTQEGKKKRTKADVYVGVAGPHKTDIETILFYLKQGKTTLEHEAWYYGMSVEDLKLLCDLD